MADTRHVDRGPRERPGPPDDRPRRTGWRRGVRVVIIAACVITFGIWTYALWFAPKDGVYIITDKAWLQQAEQLCTDANARRFALVDIDDGYITNPTPEQMERRADTVDRATAIIASMLDDIEALPLDHSKDAEKDRLRVETFVKYYRVIIADRYRYTEHLRNHELVAYSETLVEGEPVTNVITDVTNGNNIKICTPPGELGGE